jgi:hypothetical protein
MFIGAESDSLIRSLKNKFFSLLKQEKLGKTSEITSELDYLTELIRDLELENEELKDYDNRQEQKQNKKKER